MQFLLNPNLIDTQYDSTACNIQNESCLYSPYKLHRIRFAT